MNIIEYNKVKGYNYEEYVPYLLTKYGKVSGNYYSEDFSVNTSIKRRDEELFIHHIREDKVANLSDKQIAQSAPYEYQKAENLCYANLLEHILLHILIGEKNEGLGFGGAELMFTQANDFYDSFDSERESVLADGEEVLELLKERCRNGIAAYDTLLQHNATVFYDLIDILDKHGFAFLDIGTGLGKTTTALAYIRKYGMRAIVLGPNRVITDEWAKNNDVDAYSYAWFMNNYTEIDYSKYGALICDEVHHLSGKRWREGVEYVKQNGLLKIIGLTGTPNKACRDFFENRECKGFTVLDGIEREIIHNFSYVGAIYDTSGIKEKYADCKDTALLGELDLALNNTPTVKDIFLRHMPHNKRKGIIFVSRIEAIEEARAIMMDIYPDVEYREMHQGLSDAENNKTREWFQKTKKGYLFAINMISEGAHYNGVNTIIMFRRTKSSLVFNQQLGRIITLAKDEDPHAIVFDLVNNAENLDVEKSFAGSLRESYKARKERGGREKSEQIIIEDYAEKISEVLRKLSEVGQRRAVICIETQVIYNGVNEAGRLTGIQPTSISGVCSGIRITAGKYHWAYADDIERIQTLSCFIGAGPARKICPGKYKPVICFENKTEYESCQKADEDLGLSRGTVSRVCNGEYDVAKGYHFCFKDDIVRYEELKQFWGQDLTKVAHDKQAVVCIETSEIFVSIEEAKRQKGCNNIDKVLSGERYTAGGYHWCRLEDWPTYQIPKKKKHSNYKSVRCKTTGEIFETAADAIRRHPTANATGIGRCCKGTGKTSGYLPDGTRLEWEYYTEGGEE